MKSEVILKIIGLIAVSLSATGCDRLSNINTSSDCIIEKMTVANSNSAANFIKQACKEKYPPIKKEIAFTDGEANKLDGRAAINLTDEYYSGYIYNGNINLTVSKIIITVSAKKSDGKVLSKKYLHNTYIPPLSRADFIINIMPESDTVPIIDPYAKSKYGKNKIKLPIRINAEAYSWHISGAIGYP